MRRETKQGFTIIEVVLVLAIAGLIFLMVFIALPALQRSQRNTQRRDDYSMLVTAVNSYLSSNNGKITNLLKEDKTTLDASRWVNSEGKDPSGNPYEVIAMTYDTWSQLGKSIKTPGSTIKAQQECKTVNGKQQCEMKPNTGETGSQVYIVIKADCESSDVNGDPEPGSNNAARSFAVYGYLEGGGYFCQASGAVKE